MRFALTVPRKGGALRKAPRGWGRGRLGEGIPRKEGLCGRVVREVWGRKEASRSISLGGPRRERTRKAKGGQAGGLGGGGLGGRAGGRGWGLVWGRDLRASGVWEGIGGEEGGTRKGWGGWRVGWGGAGCSGWDDYGGWG